MGLVLFSLVLVLVQPWPLFQFHRGRPAAVDTVFYWKNFVLQEKNISWMNGCVFFLCLCSLLSELINLLLPIHEMEGRLAR